ncbi:MAG: hypothetical protein JWM07_683 [Candidatus Saccharibacteria bacterium]|nr:hypothetical protein [Candidatus Saccharibacteria bacterium]
MSDAIHPRGFNARKLQLERKIASAKRANDTVLVGMLQEQLAELDGTIEDPDRVRQSN